MRRSVLFDAKADILLFGNAERALVEVAHRLADGEDISTMTNIRGTAVNLPAEPEGYTVIDSSRIEKPRREAFVPKNPYEVETQCDTKKKSLLHSQSRFVHHVMMQRNTAVRLPAFEKLHNDRILYAHASRVLHLETNPYSGRALLQRHGDRELWVNQAPIPLTTEEMDYVFYIVRACSSPYVWQSKDPGLRHDQNFG